MKKKKAMKAREVRSLPAKALTSKAAKDVKGGDIALNFTKVEVKYQPQHDTGPVVEKP